MNRVLRLTVGSARVRVEAKRRGSVTWAAEAEFDGVDDLSRAIGELGAAEGLPRNARRVEVTLDPPVSQLRILTGIPPVGSAALNSLIALDAGRYFRRNGRPLVTDARWLERGRRKRRTVIAAAVEEPWLDSVAEGLTQAGFRLAGIRPAGAEATKLTLRSSAKVARTEHSVRRQGQLLLLLAAVTWLSAIGIWSVRFSQHARQVRAELAALEEPAQAAASARTAMGRAASAISAVASTKANQGVMVLQLARIAETLPPDAFLYAMEWDSDGSGTLRGSFPGGSTLIFLGHLERAGILSPRIEGTPAPEGSETGPRERAVIRFGAPRP